MITELFKLLTKNEGDQTIKSNDHISIRNSVGFTQVNITIELQGYIL